MTQTAGHVRPFFFAHSRYLPPRKGSPSRGGATGRALALRQVRAAGAKRLLTPQRQRCSVVALLQSLAIVARVFVRLRTLHKAEAAMNEDLFKLTAVEAVRLLKK